LAALTSLTTDAGGSTEFNIDALGGPAIRATTQAFNGGVNLVQSASLIGSVVLNPPYSVSGSGSKSITVVGAVTTNPPTPPFNVLQSSQAIGGVAGVNAGSVTIGDLAVLNINSVFIPGRCVSGACIPAIGRQNEATSCAEARGRVVVGCEEKRLVKILGETFEVIEPEIDLKITQELERQLHIAGGLRDMKIAVSAIAVGYRPVVTLLPPAVYTTLDNFLGASVQGLTFEEPEPGDGREEHPQNLEISRQERDMGIALTPISVDRPL
jgi:hypothetical protein